MSDLQNPQIIYAKGFLFLLCGLISAALLVIDSFQWKTAVLLSLCVWSFCRCYYFAFYVIENYVDSEFRFAGLLDFMKYIMRREKNESGGDADELMK